MTDLTLDLTLKKAWQGRFLKELCKTGNVQSSCRKAKVTRQNAYLARKADVVFAAAWEEAIEIATEALELEARRRAERGVLEPIYYQGERVGAVRKYSDTLLIFLLKAHRPEKYRDNVRHEVGGPGGGPIEIKEVVVERTLSRESGTHEGS